MKLKAMVLCLMISVLGSTNTKANQWWSFGRMVYDYWDSAGVCPVDIGANNIPANPCVSWEININQPNFQLPAGYTEKVYIDTPLFTETGIYGYEPVLPDTLDPWSTSFKKSCPDVSVYKDMSIISQEDGWTNYVSYTGTGVSIKTFTVNQGVPFEFAAHRHHWATRQLIDTYYFWAFGDGVRRLNKKKQVNKVTHKWKELGTHILSSLVYTQDYFVYLGADASIDGDFGYQFSGWDFGFRAGGLYLEGCDIAEINVVPNDPPVASGCVFSKSQTGLHSQNIIFTAEGSSDPNNNPLTYTWTYGNIVQHGEMAAFYVSRPELQPEAHNITLKVTDGGKEDEITFTFYADPYCFACNGQSVL